jgi:DNA gyrase subunit B
MYQLIQGGHIYIACPPLYRIRRKGQKDEYIQTDEEMRKILLEMGLKNAVFNPGDGRIFEGEALDNLCKTLAHLEDAVIALERRGISLRTHAVYQDKKTAKLAVFHVLYNDEERWFVDRNQVQEYKTELEARLGKEITVDDSFIAEADSKAMSDGEPRIRIVELHEVRSINKYLLELREQGFEVDALLPQERTGSDTARFYLNKGEAQHGLEDLRELLKAVQKGGEKGMQVTRFKGLGEMDPEELRDTTLNMNNRRLIKVTMDDAAAADDLFRILMGDQVEPRREFIEKHALEVQHLDV